MGQQMPKPAPVERQPGSATLRCTACGKAAWPTEDDALAAAAIIRAGSGDILYAYFNEACRWYHLTHMVPVVPPKPRRVPEPRGPIAYPHSIGAARRRGR